MISVQAAEPVRIVQVPYDSERLTLDAVPPIWDKGYLVGYSRGYSYGDSPRIWMYDRRGQPLISGVRLSFPETIKVIVHSLAVTGDGKVLISAEAWSSQSQFATVLCEMKPPGVIESVVSNESFAAESMVVRPDGTVWALGNDPSRIWTAGADYSLLERYDRSGVLIGRHLPRSEFCSNDPVVASEHGYGSITSSADRVGLYLAGAETWVEFDASGRLLDQFHLAAPPLLGPNAAPGKSLSAVRPIVMTASDRVYGVFTTTGGIRPDRSTGAGLYQLDRKLQRWVRVPPELDRDPAFGLVYGADGDEIIARSGCCRYGWFSVPDVVHSATAAAR